MAVLRDYQQGLLDRVDGALQPPGARVVLQLPTGGGKTHIAGALLRRWLHEGRKAAWLTHRTELADQTCGMLADAGVSAISLNTWQAGNDAPSVPNGVVILMAQTVGRRSNRMQVWGEYGSGDLLVIDEAHHATANGWERAIDQWPGRVIGLTATPWRLSKTEGFDHLFEELLQGPQVSQLQGDGWLCQASVLMPKPEEIIRGGAINAVGEYSESGIQQANQDRPDIMTAGALHFWLLHAAERQTIVYAISQDHARNLAAVFNEAGIPATVMLSDTMPQDRAEAIKAFGDGALRVLVNVAVATEGFDLPDASCIVITRPTMSLALYLQMVGRGLRPKANEGNCLILDLAGNAEVHGLPEQNRHWSLEPRGSNPGGDAPVVHCEKCGAVSPAASHFCVFCQSSFGKECRRCGAWRAWQRWRYETYCDELHELVCDLCHYDAHIQARLPVSDDLRRLTDMGPDLDAVLQSLLEEERRRAGGAEDERKRELRSFITARESELASDILLQMFKNHIDTLQLEARPKSELEEYRLFPEWEDDLKRELAGWIGELGKLESKVPDRRLIYNNARERVLQALEFAAQETGLLSQTTQGREPPARNPISEPSNLDGISARDWMSFVQLGEWGNTGPTGGGSVKPKRFRDACQTEVLVRSWPDLLFQTADSLVKKGLIAKGDCPITTGGQKNRYMINTEPVSSRGTKFHSAKKLSNGLYIECNFSAKDTARVCEQLLSKFGQDPAQFHVLLG